MNKAELAGACGVSVNTVSDWVHKGCPMERRGRSGKTYDFDLNAVRAWRARHFRLQAPATERESLDLGPILARTFERASPIWVDRAVETLGGTRDEALRFVAWLLNQLCLELGVELDEEQGFSESECPTLAPSLPRQGLKVWFPASRPRAHKEDAR